MKEVDIQSHDVAAPVQPEPALSTDPPELDRPWAVMGRFAFYDGDGRIASVATMQQSLCDQVAKDHGGLSWMELDRDIDPATSYVKDGAVLGRPANPATLDGAKLSSLPAPCTITINGTAYVCDDGAADLEFAQPGTYQVVVSAWPYLEKEFTLENPAQ